MKILKYFDKHVKIKYYIYIKVIDTYEIKQKSKSNSPKVPRRVVTALLKIQTYLLTFGNDYK